MKSVCTGAVVALVLSATGCRAAAIAPPSKPAEVSFIGRFDLRDSEAPRCAWPGSQITARFSGPWIRATLTDSPADGDSRETDWIAVLVDDAPPRAFKLSEGRHVYPLATGLGAGEHDITIWKRTEAAVGTITFHGFKVAIGEHLMATKAGTRHIEIVGDSISVGYGNEGPDAWCRASARRENNHQTYGAVAARALNASYTAIAWSGKGVTRNFDPTDPLTLPLAYARVIPTEDDSPLAGIDPVPSAYVVNLGTNDMFAGVADSGDFRRDYLGLLKALRVRAPHALIVLALGPMLFDDPPRSMQRSIMRGWLSQIENEWRTAVDNRIASIELWTDPAEGIGCDSHPNVRTHQRFGDELATLLREHLGW